MFWFNFLSILVCLSVSRIQLWRFEIFLREKEAMAFLRTVNLLREGMNYSFDSIWQQNSNKFHFVLLKKKFPHSARLRALCWKIGQLRNWDYTVEELMENSSEDIDIAWFSAGWSISTKFSLIAPELLYVLHLPQLN